MTKKLSHRKTKNSYRSQFNNWFEMRVKGNEKTFIAIMFLLCLISFAFMIYKRLYTEDFDKTTFQDVIEDIDEMQKPAASEGISIMSSWEQMKKDEKALELINKLQYEFEQEKLDTVVIKELTRELKIYSK